MLNLLERQWIRRRPSLRTAFILLFSMAFLLVFAISLPSESLLKNTPALILFVFEGAILGYILSLVRWKPFWCIAYTLIIILLTACQQSAHMMPPLGTLPFWDWLTRFNWEMYLFLARVSNWLENIVHLKAFQDPAWMTFILIVQAELMGAWFVWMLHRYRRLWLSALPLLLYIAFYGYTGQAESTNVLYALIFLVCLTAMYYFENLQQQWQSRGVDYPESLWQDWSVAVVLMCALVMPLAYLAPKVATPEGWQEIHNWYEEVQRSAGNENAGLTSHGQGGQTGSIYIGERYLGAPDVGKIGAPLPQSDALAMWIRSTDPTPRNWRAAIFSTYTGTGWEPAQETALDTPISYDPLQQIPLGFKALDQTFVLSGHYGGDLFSPGDPAEVFAQGLEIVKVQPDGSTLLKGDISRYEIVSLVPNVSAERLRAGYANIPEDIAQTYLQLPEDLPERVKLLTRGLVIGKNNQLDQVVAVQNYLRSTIPYDLNTPPPPEGEDVVDYFLFEAPSGFCTYYASSIAVMLRILGIPARVVTGYAAGSYIVQQGVFQVPGNAAHAWVEVYFGTYGWIPFEPTPAYEIPFYAQAQMVVAPPQALPQQQAAHQIFWLNAGLTLLGLALAAGMGTIAWRAWQTRRMIARFTHHPVARIYLAIRYRLQTIGLTSSPARTPREFLSDAAIPLAAYPRVGAYLQLCTELLEQAVYSSLAPDTEQVRALRNARHAARPDWLRMSLNMGLQKIRQLAAALKRSPLRE